jgi:N-acyl homoserine lactone hydrolase
MPLKTITANRAMTTLQERTAVKRALADSRFLLVGHDAPALVRGGKVVARCPAAIDNPRADVTNAANYLPPDGRLARAA